MDSSINLYISNIDVLRILTSSGAGNDINRKDRYGRTLLMNVASFTSKEVVELLLKCGADPNIANIFGETAIMHASSVGYIDVVELLLKHSDFSANIANRSIIGASSEDRTMVVNLLLKFVKKSNIQNNINATDEYGFTALMRAAGSTDTVRLLLDHNADTEVKCKRGRTVLMSSVSLGCTDTIKLLLDRGANIEAKDNDGLTALLQASQKGQTNIVKLLLDSGADIEAKDNNGKTALEHASQKGHKDVVRLIKRSIDLKNKDKDMAFMLAFSRVHTEMAKLLGK